MIYRQIQINDTVKVIDSGEVYSGYTEMFARMGFKDTTGNKPFGYGTVATVFAIDTHLEHRNTLYALVDSEGRECLISERGIELVEYTAVDTSTIDRINDRLAKIESQLDTLANRLNKPKKSQTAVEWLIDELKSYDSNDGKDYYDICVSVSKMVEIKTKALEMEKQQNSK
jgi:hypothetical protein